MTKLTFPKVFDTFNQVSWHNDLVHGGHLLYESGNHFLYKSVSNEYFSFRPVVKLTGSRFDALVTSHFLAYSDYQWDEVELRPDDVKVVHKVFSTCTMGNTFIRNTIVNFYEWSGGASELMLLKLVDDLVQTNKITVNIFIDERGLDLKPSVIEILNTILMGPNAIHKKEYTMKLDHAHTHTPRFTNRYRNFIKEFCNSLAECLVQNSSVTGVILPSVSAEDIDQIFTRLSQGNVVSKLTHLTCTKGHRKSPSRSKQPPICQKFCTSLATFLSRNTSLIEVDLDIPLHSDLISSYVETIKSGLVHNKSLQKLSIGYRGLNFGELVFERNKCTNEIELIKVAEPSDLHVGYDDGSFQSNDCDPSPPQAKRPCQDNQGCGNFSPLGHRDSTSPDQLCMYGLDIAHSSQQFQPQIPKSDCLSPPLPPPNHPVKDHGSIHDIIDLTVESPPRQDIQSPDVIDLTQDSPQPYDHVDDTHSSALPSSTTTSPKSSSVNGKTGKPS